MTEEGAQDDRRAKLRMTADSLIPTSNQQPATSNQQPATSNQHQQPVPGFTHYIALGDSMSIDLYPALDVGEIDVAVALERVTTAGRVAPLGAASLLYQNSEEYYPDRLGHDLVSVYPGMEFRNLASDGATIGEV